MADTTTIGRIVFNRALPTEYRDENAVHDKKTLTALLTRIAKDKPDDYPEISRKVEAVLRHGMTGHGRDMSIDFASMRPPPAIQAIQKELRAKALKISQDPELDSDAKSAAIVKLIVPEMAKVQEAIKNIPEGQNTFIDHIKSGARGNPGQVMQLLVGDMMVADHKGNPVPVPGLRGYNEGVSTAEYWAGSYGARKGYMDVQFATADAGYFGKQLTHAAHKVVVTEDDCGANDTGLEVEGSDPDNVGSMLAMPVGDLKAGHLIEKGDLSHLDGKKIYVRSAATCQAKEGICSKCAGVREGGALPSIGDHVGISAARAIAEPTTQSGLCLEKGTLVRMADMSVKAIEDITVGEMVLGADANGRTKPTTVLNTFNSGVKSVYKTTFKQGSSCKAKLELNSSLEHKCLLMTRKSSCKDERFNGIPRILPIGTAGKFLYAVRETGSEDMPNYINEPFDLLLGLLLGDGCYTKAVGGVFFSCADSLLVEDTATYMNSLNLKFKQLKYHNGIYYNVSFLEETKHPKDSKGRAIKGFLNPIKKYLDAEGMLGKYAHEKALPAGYRNWTNESIARLLAGLFATDGSIYKTALAGTDIPFINFTSTSHTLITQVIELLRWRFGIHTSALDIRPISTTHKHHAYSVNISTYDGVRRFHERIPMLGIKRRKLDAYMMTVEDKPGLKYSRCRRETCEYKEELPTFDIEVDNEDHLFLLANGLIVSNSEKHKGGLAKEKTHKHESELSGFKAIDQFMQVPKAFVGAATLASKDGRVEDIRKAPQGGWYIKVNGADHYATADHDITAKKGDIVEAGDALTSGVPHPAEVVKHKGIGEGRRYFIQQYGKILKDNGAGNHRRNLEALARGFINRVEITDPQGFHGFFPGDVVAYDDLARDYEPREDSQLRRPTEAVGMWLEKPVLHHAIGDKITPGMARKLTGAGIKAVLTHHEAPAFEPVVSRMMDIAATDSDWMARLGGFNLKSSFVDAANRGASSDTKGTSYIPQLVSGQIDGSK